MRFALGDDRTEFAAAVRKALSDGCPPTVVRAAWTDAPLDRAIWQTLVDMGTTDPELDWVTRVAVAEEVGRAALPHPYVETAFVAGPVLGAALGTQMATTPFGRQAGVPCGADADVFVDRDETGFFAMDAEKLRTSPIGTVDGARRLAHLGWTTSEAGMGIAGSAGRRLDLPVVDPVAAGALGTAATLVGLGQHLVDVTVDYVKERHQFGQPVGGFQAVKHHLANAAKDIAFARPMVHRAAYGLDTAPDAVATSRDISTAKALASDAATVAAEVALQCHGAIAYTVEYDVQLWLKRTWALTRAYGDARTHRRLVAASLGLTSS